MGRKTKITKDTIINCALKLLIRDGYESVNVKTVAKEAGCSTQPIAWHFENMDNLRRELTDAAFAYASRLSAPADENPVKAFVNIGKAYVDMAFDAPNLIRFVVSSDKGRNYEGEFIGVFDRARSESMVRSLAETMKVSEKDVRFFMETGVIYAHGLAMLIINDRLKIDRKGAHVMVENACYRYLLSLGIGEKEASLLLGDGYGDG